MTAFMARPISIRPPKICRYFVGKFLNKYPNQNPKREFIKVTTPINIEGNQTFTWEKQSVMPAPKASMLVATANANKHPKDKQEIVSSFSFSNASFINFIPKITKITKTIHVFINCRYL